MATQAYVTQTDDCSKVVLFSSQEGYWFDQTGPTSFAPLYGSHHALTSDSWNYRLTAPDGTVFVFSGTTGKLLQMITPGGQITENVYDGSGKLTETRWSVTVSGTTYVESWKYEYGTNAEASWVKIITLRQGNSTSGPWTDVRRLLLDYHPSSSSHGTQGDLMRLTLETWNGSAWAMISREYFRYYTSTGGDGVQHGLKYVVGPEAYRRMVAASLDPTTATDTQVGQYADMFYKFDTAKRRVKQSVAAAGTRTFDMTYAEGTNYISYNSWQLKTEVARPDNSKRILYSNHVAQELLTDLWQNKNNAADGRWVTFTKYTSQGRLNEEYTPKAIDMAAGPYTALSNQTNPNVATLNVSLKTSDGLVRITNYYSTGDGAGYPENQQVRRGSGGTVGNGGLVTVRGFTYLKRTINGGTATQSVIVLPASVVEYRDTGSGGSDGVTTSFGYTFHTGTNQINTRTTTLPAVPIVQNGTNTTSTIVEEFDIQNRLVIRTDPRTTVTKHTLFDEMTAAVTQTVEDFGTGKLNLTTDFVVDRLGRTERALGPARVMVLGTRAGGYTATAATARPATWTFYNDAGHQIRIASGYVDGTTEALINPVRILFMDHADRVANELVVSQSNLSDVRTFAAVARTSWHRWSKQAFADSGLLTESRIYHLIPSGTSDPDDPSGGGSAGTNYNATAFGYDGMARRNKTTSPGGTITKSTLDGNGRATLIEVGRSETVTDLLLVPVTAFLYDPNGNVTRRTEHVNSTTTRVLDYTYDFRDRQIILTGPEALYIGRLYDNLDRLRFVSRLDGNNTSILLDWFETRYDTRGRVYRSLVYDVVGGNTTGKTIVENNWYDAGGNLIKQQPMGWDAFTKTVYDAVGRPIKEFVAYFSGSGSDDPAGLTNNFIFEQVNNTFDVGGNVTLATRRRRFHSATNVAGELTSPNGSQPKARVSFVANWYDPLGRTVASADYGTNNDDANGTPPTIPSTPPTASDSDKLVTATDFNAAGEPADTYDTGGLKTNVTFDAAERPKVTVTNPGGGALETTVTTTYAADGGVATLTATNSDTGAQLTTYTHGTTLTESDIARSDLLLSETYPDPADANDKISYKYNRQGQVREQKDQNGTVRQFLYDGRGRMTADFVPDDASFGTGVDKFIKRIEASYLVRGMVEKLTSFTAHGGGSGNEANQVQLAYNGFGQVATEYQQTNGPVVISTSPKVEYTHSPGSSDGGDQANPGPATNNFARLTGANYPTNNTNYGRVAYSYTGDPATKFSRTSDISYAGAIVVNYAYLGLRDFVVADYVQPDVRWTVADLGASPPTNPYIALDPLDRAKQVRWEKYNGSVTLLEHLEHGYDTASNRKYRRNVLANTSGHSELYAYDALHRLTNFKRGELSPGNDGILSAVQEQAWTLDRTGNWKAFNQLSPVLLQTRTHSEANEIETIGTWAVPAYDRNGNTTKMPQPAALASAYQAVYDAWNRLVRIGTDATPSLAIAEFQYDGSHRNTIKKAYNPAGTLSETRHFYYSQDWQVVEERVGTSPTTADKQYVWGQRYIDDCVLRIGPDLGTSTEKLHALQDANWNVTALVGFSTGNVLERYEYDPYGQRAIMDASFASRASSNYVWILGLSGYRLTAEIGIYQIRYRHLHSQLGRWLTRDPLHSFDTLTNLYSYVGNMPERFTDPYGLRGGLSDPKTAAFVAKQLAEAARRGPEAFRRELLDWASVLGIGTLELQSWFARNHGSGSTVPGSSPPAPAPDIQPRQEPRTEPKPDPKPRTDPKKDRRWIKDPDEECAAKYPGYDLCANYDYDTLQEARKCFGHGAKLEKPRPAEACGAGGGMHYNVRQYGRFCGSIICCNCCEGQLYGPAVIKLKCNINPA